MSPGLGRGQSRIAVDNRFPDMGTGWRGRTLSVKGARVVFALIFGGPLSY